jgi:hypothetical protein
MGVIDTVKDVALLVQKVDNIDLVKHVLALQQDVLSLVEENRALKNENRGLKEQAATREKLKFLQNSYWTDDGDGPFCSRCWDAETKLVRLHKMRGASPSCPSCDRIAPDPNPPRQAAVVRTVRPR